MSLSTVLNLAKLALMISFGFAYLSGLGWLVARMFSKAMDGIFHNSDRSLIQVLPLTITVGLIINYGLSLLFQGLSIGIIIACILSILGIWQFGYRYTKNHDWTLDKATPGNWVGVFFLFLFYTVPILFLPLTEWDARSIWFFHAKMIYFAGSFGTSAGWQHPSVEFSHVDYPNLVSGIAAQSSYLLGFWNEYIPKLSLVFVLLPALMWLFSFSIRSLSFLIILVLPFSLSSWLWNGYMDGYLALYFCISMLLIGRYIQSSDPMDLISSIISLLFSMYLKNEGQLLVIAGGISIIFMTLIPTNRNKQIAFIQKTPKLKILVALLIFVFPLFLWSFYKWQWGLSNDLKIGTIQSVLHIIERVKDGSYILILQRTREEIVGALQLLGLVFFVTVAQDIKLPKAALPAITASVIYYCGVFLVYMLTPNDLIWHLNASVDRTMLAVQGSLLVGCYYILVSLEKRMSVIVHDPSL